MYTGVAPAIGAMPAPEDGRPGRPETMQNAHLIYGGVLGALVPAHEWRRVFSEVMGTFFLVLVATGPGVVRAATGSSLGQAADAKARDLRSRVRLDDSRARCRALAPVDPLGR
jgi:hypothetical protein